MKTLTFLFFAALLSINNIVFQSPQESPELAEAAALTEQLIKLFKDGKVDDALSRAKRALEIRERLLPPTDPRVSTSLRYLADIYLYKRNYKAAEEVYKRALTILGKRSGIKDPEFELASDGLTCVSYKSKKPELMNELNEIRKQFAPPTDAAGSERHVLDGKALHLPKPSYPSEARERLLSGIVVVKVEVDEEGKVISATDLCQGPPYLSESALISARGARFEPKKINGQPVKFKGTIKYTFVSSY